MSDIKRKFNLSINKCGRAEVELEDVSFENSLLRQIDLQRPNRSANSTLVVLDGTFSELLPMQPNETINHTTSNEYQLVQRTSSEQQLDQAGPSSSQNRYQEERAGPSSRQTYQFVRPEEQPGPSSAMYSNITCYDEQEVEEAEDQFPMSQLSHIPDFSTAVTSTPRRELDDEDGPILIDLDLIRRTIIREKEHQRHQARMWYDEVRDCLQSKTKPYSRKLMERKGVLNHQISKIKRQREALDQLLSSLERENRDVNAQILYLETFIDNFPGFQAI